MSRRNGSLFLYLALLVPSAVGLLFRTEIWPFSTYDMYSRPLFKKSREAYVIHVESQYGFKRVMGMDSLFPLGPHCLHQCLRRLSPGDQAAFAKYLFDRCTANPKTCYLPADTKVYSVTISHAHLFTEFEGRTTEAKRSTLVHYRPGSHRESE